MQNYRTRYAIAEEVEINEQSRDDSAEKQGRNEPFSKGKH